MSSRGESSGGGQSSLNYLFGSEEQPKPPPPKTVSYPLPPYGIDIDNNHNPPTGQGQHLGNVLTNRPSTKVQSVPGGHSSLGYLFGDKWYRSCFHFIISIDISNSLIVLHIGASEKEYQQPSYCICLKVDIVWGRGLCTLIGWVFIITVCTVGFLWYLAS